MALPSTDELLASCNNLRKDGLRILAETKARGADVKEIRKHESIIRKVEKIIALKGGQVDA